jgi:hypothetical protein
MAWGWMLLLALLAGLALGTFALPGEDPHARGGHLSFQP